jgi:hypothetical protein
MLLKRVGTAPERKLSTDLNEGIPFDVELAPEVSSIDDLFYWTSANGTYLLEVKIVAATGMIGGVTLVLVPTERRRIVGSVRQLESRTDKGVPLVDLAPWKARIGNREFGIDPAVRFIDESVPFVFAIGTDGIAVYFETGEAVSSVANGDLTFSFTEDDLLCGMTLTGFARAGLKLMRKLHGPDAQ